MHVYIRTQKGNRIAEINKMIEIVKGNKYWITTGRGSEQIVLAEYETEELANEVFDQICEMIKRSKNENVYIDLR